MPQLTARQELLGISLRVGAGINRILMSNTVFLFEMSQDCLEKSLEPPDCMCLPTNDGLFIEMVAPDIMRDSPRAMLTPWGARFCFSPNIRIDDAAVAKLAGEGIELEKVSEPVHDKNKQTIYAVRSYLGTPLPEPSLMDWQTDTYQGLLRLAEWCHLAKNHIPEYLDWLRKTHPQMDVDSLLAQAEQAAPMQ